MLLMDIHEPGGGRKDLQTLNLAHTLSIRLACGHCRRPAGTDGWRASCGGDVAGGFSGYQFQASKARLEILDVWTQWEQNEGQLSE